MQFDFFIFLFVDLAQVVYFPKFEISVRGKTKQHKYKHNLLLHFSHPKKS